MTAESARRSQYGPDPKYDWDVLFDGKVHHLPLGALPSTPRNFARQVRRAAAVRDLRVKIVTRARLGVFVEVLAAGEETC
jgi:hypothetical protein